MSNSERPQLNDEPETVEPYVNTATVRWIVEVSRSGDQVVLDDGSTWHVVPSHRLISGNWPRTLKVRVSPVQGRLYVLSAESDRDVQAAYQGLRHLDGADAPDSAPRVSEPEPRSPVDPAVSGGAGPILRSGDPGE